jgi:hypothetical protein
MRYYRVIYRRADDTQDDWPVCADSFDHAVKCFFKYSAIAIFETNGTVVHEDCIISITRED